MGFSNKKQGLMVLIFIIFLPFFLLLISYKATLLVFPLTPAQEEVFQFLQGKEQLPAEYTALEKSHLEDVRQVMKWMDLALGIVLIIILSLIVYLKNKDEVELLRKSLQYGGIATMGLIGALLLLIFFDFTTIFTAFHQLFFPQGNWMFPADSLLIQTFPVEFFIRVSQVIFLFTVLLGLGAFLLSKYFARK